MEKMAAPEGKYLASVKVGPKGQIVIPKEARELFGIQSGDTLWDIARDNMTDEYDSIDEYINAIKDINGLESDFIQSGQYLIIKCSN